MKLLSVFFLLVLIAVARTQHNGLVGCQTSADCVNWEVCVNGVCKFTDPYECNPKCADGLACLQGVCVDGN